MAGLLCVVRVSLLSDVMCVCVCVCEREREREREREKESLMLEGRSLVCCACESSL